MNETHAFQVIKLAAMRYQRSDRSDREMSRLLHTQTALECGDLAKAQRYQELPAEAYTDNFFSREFKREFDRNHMDKFVITDRFVSEVFMDSIRQKNQTRLMGLQELQ